MQGSSDTHRFVDNYFAPIKDDATKINTLPLSVVIAARRTAEGAQVGAVEFQRALYCKYSLLYRVTLHRRFST
jgi:hypothetical protein